MRIMIAGSRSSARVRPTSSGCTSSAIRPRKSTSWPDDRIWANWMPARNDDGWELYRGAIFEKGIIPMRSFVVEPMQFGRCSSPATQRILFHRPARRE